MYTEEQLEAMNVSALRKYAQGLGLKNVSNAYSTKQSLIEAIIETQREQNGETEMSDNFDEMDTSGLYDDDPEAEEMYGHNESEESSETVTVHFVGEPQVTPIATSEPEYEYEEVSKEEKSRSKEKAEKKNEELAQKTGVKEEQSDRLSLDIKKRIKEEKAKKNKPANKKPEAQQLAIDFNAVEEPAPPSSDPKKDSTVTDKEMSKERQRSMAKKRKTDLDDMSKKDYSDAKLSVATMPLLAVAISGIICSVLVLARYAYEVAWEGHTTIVDWYAGVMVALLVVSILILSNLGKRNQFVAILNYIQPADDKEDSDD